MKVWKRQERWEQRAGDKREPARFQAFFNASAGFRFRTLFASQLHAAEPQTVETVEYKQVDKTDSSPIECCVPVFGYNLHSQNQVF